MMNKKISNLTKDQSGHSNCVDEGIYEIHVRGHLDESWSEWLEGMQVSLKDNGEMILYGHITDQAALMGILNKLYGLNLTLLSVIGIKQHESKGE